MHILHCTHTGNWRIVVRMGDNENRIVDPGTAPTCAGCNCFRADVLNVATDEGPKPLCWLCRHAVVEHGIPLARVAMGVAPEHSTYRDADDNLRIRWDDKHICMHTRVAIYPPDVIKRRDELKAAKDKWIAEQLEAAWPRSLVAREAA